MIKLGRPWQELVEVDPPSNAPITDETKRRTVEYSGRFRGSVRVALGLLWTDEEYAKYRTDVLKRPLP